MLLRLHPLIFETGTSLTMTRIQLEFFDCYPEFLREVFVLLIMWIGRIRGVFFPDRTCSDLSMSPRFVVCC